MSVELKEWSGSNYFSLSLSLSISFSSSFCCLLPKLRRLSDEIGPIIPPCRWKRYKRGEVQGGGDPVPSGRENHQVGSLMLCLQCVRLQAWPMDCRWRSIDGGGGGGGRNGTGGWCEVERRNVLLKIIGIGGKKELMERAVVIIGIRVASQEPKWQPAKEIPNKKINICLYFLSGIDMSGMMRR